MKRLAKSSLTAFVMATMSAVCIEQRAEAKIVDHTTLFESIGTSDWIAFGSENWYRKYITEKGTFIVTTWIAFGRVYFRTWTLCEKPGVLDGVTWKAGDDTGLRNDCDGKVSEVIIPQYSEDLFNDLPSLVRAILAYERMNMIRRPRFRWNI